MPRRSLLNFPVGSAASWLDLIPRVDVEAAAEQVSPPNPSIVARINKLRETLADVKLTIDNRNFFLMLDSHDGRYCHSCSTTNQPAGSCGPTCSLLRPENRRFNLAMTRVWRAHAVAERTIYESLVDEMDCLGYEVNAPTLKRWEKTAGNLVVGDASSSRHNRETKWKQICRSNGQAGFRSSWGLEGSWGKGLFVGSETDVSPSSPCP
ncbi:hypothetical protein BKA66DRAFT_587256 [Pyrenochaeta sp. MPI-SDFR-AT-0127]|nr:hypothetical protein BKA66DRAFT_587256 [Pyrenochaeta sp. MPI-SDFR-AT-0127]